MKTYLIFLCAALLLTACDKINKTTVSGKVINAVTGKPIPNVKIVIENHHGVRRLAVLMVIVLYSGVTDSAGGFYTEFDESSKRNVKLTCYIDSEDSDTLQFFPSATKWGTNDEALLEFYQDNNVTLRVAPMASLALDIHNMNYFDNKDSIIIRRYNHAVNWTTEKPVSFTGNARIKGWEQNIPMGWIHFDWDVTRNGVTSYHHDSVWCKSGALTRYQINY